MKLQIKSLIAVTAVAAVFATSFSNKGKEVNTAGNEQETVANADIRGQWNIENIVFNDSDYVRPDEAVPGANQYITFDDSTYFIQTNCNTFSGSYMVNGDSIALSDGAMTEMACDNMETEDALRRILPKISTIDIQNDSVVRLNGSLPSECILLRKAK